MKIGVFYCYILLSVVRLLWGGMNKVNIIKEWRNRDWIWVISILLGIIIIILTWRLNDKDNVVNIISMFASGASIILAVVAIVQSTIYNSSSNELYARMTEKLSSLENNVELVKSNILNNASEVIDNAPIKEEIKEEMKLSLENVINDEYYLNNNVASAYVIEKIIYDKFKYAYSENYKVRSNIRIGRSEVDSILESDSKIIIVELKVWSQPKIPMLKQAINKINDFQDKVDNPNKKEIIPILIIVSNDPKYRRLIENSSVNIVYFTQNELLNISNNEFKQKINI